VLELEALEELEYDFLQFGVGLGGDLAGLSDALEDVLVGCRDLGNESLDYS